MSPGIEESYALREVTMFKGSLVALITPMKADGSIDKKSLSYLIDWHMASKTQALVIAGTTGEGPTLTPSEQYDLISYVVAQVAHRIPVIAGTGSYSTQHAIELTHQAKKAGADAALIVTPYYNKPTQNGLYEHYKAIADHVALPIILYNVPSRTACDILPETVERLSKIPSIVGIKEASGSVQRVIDILSRCDSRFVVYSGDDITAFDFLLHGAQGVISVTANVAPEKIYDFCEAALTDQKKRAEALNQALLPLHKTLFVETNPIPVKWALHEMGYVPSGIRLPLLPLDARYRADLRDVLKKTGALA